MTIHRKTPLYHDHEKHPMHTRYLWFVRFAYSDYNKILHEVEMHIVHPSSDADTIRSLLADEWSSMGKDHQDEPHEWFEGLKEARFLGEINCYEWGKKG